MTHNNKIQRKLMPAIPMEKIYYSIFQAEDEQHQDLRFSIQMPVGEISRDRKIELPLDEVVEALSSSVDKFRAEVEAGTVTQGCWLYSDSKVING